ncbi:MAG: hypothetical protein GKR89_35915 [Candidatus Latescibacteria bacterium]|nr:hypothetical protein [Candidatus Latescibacterota bacterium]
MRAPTHIAFGLLTTTGVFALVSQSLHQDWLAIGGALVGSLLPDMDSPRSTLGRLLPFISGPVERRWGHRTITHGLGLLAGLGGVLAPLLWLRPGLYAAVLLGYASHLLADCATKSGVPLFYPHPAVCVVPGSARYRLETGSLGERILLIVLVLLLGVAWPLSQAGGVWRAMRWVLASPAAAYSDYRGATTETYLRFSGRWQETKQPVEGEALILDGQPGRFVLFFQDQVWTYGEGEDILPDRSRVQVTQRPLQIDTVLVQGQSWSQVQAQFSPGSFISGRLVADHLFDLVGIGLTPQSRHQPAEVLGGELVLSWAPWDLLARLRAVSRIDEVALEQQWHQVQAVQTQLTALQVQQPPVHYLTLRDAQSRLEVAQRRLEALAAVTVRFTGGVFVRRVGL